MKWLADENFRNAIIRGLVRQAPTIDIVRAQDVPETAGRDDLALLRFGTTEGRVVVTHDVSTMIPAMREQMRVASRCTPIVLVPDSLPVIAAVEDLLLLNECAVEADWAAGVTFLSAKFHLPIPGSRHEGSSLAPCLSVSALMPRVSSAGCK